MAAGVRPVAAAVVDDRREDAVKAAVLAAVVDRVPDSIARADRAALVLNRARKRRCPT